MRPGLEFQAFGRGGRTHFAAPGPPALAGCGRGGGRGFGRGPFGGLDGRGVAADVADEFGSGVGFDHLFVDLLGQLVLRKRGESAAEGGFAGNLPGAVPAAELAQPGAGPERVEKRASGGELIDVLGR